MPENLGSCRNLRATFTAAELHRVEDVVAERFPDASAHARRLDPLHRIGREMRVTRPDMLRVLEHGADRSPELRDALF